MERRWEERGESGRRDEMVEEKFKERAVSTMPGNEINPSLGFERESHRPWSG